MTASETMPHHEGPHTRVVPGAAETRARAGSNPPVPVQGMPGVSPLAFEYVTFDMMCSAEGFHPSNIHELLSPSKRRPEGATSMDQL